MDAMTRYLVNWPALLLPLVALGTVGLLGAPVPQILVILAVLKDRVFSDAAFADAVRDVAAGSTVLDPEVVSRLMTKRARSGPLAALTPREREVLSLMAQGRSNAAIAAKLYITEKAVSRHAAGIFSNLGLAQSDDDNRRVLAVLAYLSA
jgi:DNA-binding NarL/FixJ family response regulator